VARHPVTRLLVPLFATLLLLGGRSAATSQEPKADVKKSEAKNPALKQAAPAAATPAAHGAEPADVQVHFINGSLLRLLVHSEKLEIATDYGKLAVPVKDIRSIEFGLRFPEGAAARIEAAVSALGDGEYRAREKASKTLLELGPYSYPAVLEASRSKELETSRRAKEVLKQLESKHPKKALRTSTEDKLVTRAFPIAGRILTPTLRATTDLFGEVEFSLAKMETLKAMAAPAEQAGEVSVSIDAAKYANLGQWLETSVEVDGRTALTITAKGVVDTWPQQPNQWITGPAGVQGGRVMFGGGQVFVGGAGRNLGAQMLQINGGALFGRIGDNGEPFMIGERYTGTPPGEGKLYLTIGPSPWGCPSAGSYEVKITR
jgi:hypothetical protein